MQTIHNLIVLLGFYYVGVQGKSSTLLDIKNGTISPQHPDPYQQSIVDDQRELPIQLDTPSTSATDQILYSPARGPALPLAVRSPYTSAWISTANNGSLSSAPAVFW
jgi:hypothetical protein